MCIIFYTYTQFTGHTSDSKTCRTPKTREDNVLTNPQEWQPCRGQ